MSFPMVWLTEGVVLSGCFLNNQMQTWHIKKPTKQGFAYCVDIQYRKLWFWCITNIFSKKYKQFVNAQNFWDKKIIGKFSADIC